MSKNQYNTVKLVLNTLDKVKSKDELVDQVRKTRKINEAKAIQLVEQAYELSLDVRKKIDALLGMQNPFSASQKSTSKLPVKQKSLDEVVREIKSLREFEENVQSYVHEHIGPKLEKVKLPTLEELEAKPVQSTDRSCIIVFTDTHIGSQCKSSDNLKGFEWNSAIAIETMHRVIDQSMEKLSRGGYEKVIVAYGGDLFHTLTGTTQKGTKLERELNGFEQFETTLETIRDITLKLVKEGYKVENYFVVGNHDGITGYCLGSALKHMFDFNPEYKERVTWNVSQTEQIFFEANENTLCCLHHGASATTDFKFAAGVSKATEAKVGGMFSAYSAMKKKFYKSHIMIVGDKHHFSCHEYSHFLFVQIGSIVKADHYAENMQLRSRPQQGMITVDKNGFESIGVIYTD